MSDRTCPLNGRSCNCDPTSADKRRHPCVLANDLGNMVRRMASPFDGEAANALGMLRKRMLAEGLNLNLTFCDFATLFENCRGQIEEKKYSDSDMGGMWERAVAQGREQGLQEQQLEETEFRDEFGEPKWHAIALYCQDRINRLNEWEREFINNMAGKTMWRNPKGKEPKHLLAIFLQLGGRLKS